MSVSEIGMKGTERTQVDDVTLKILELRPIDGECRDVASVVAVVNPDGDLGSPVDITEPAAVGILPLGFDFGEKRLESGVVFVLVVQGVLLASQGRAVLLARLQPQVRQFSGKSNGIAEPCVDGVFDLDDGTSETAFTTDKDVLRVGPVELVMGGRVDGGDVFVGEGEDPIAGVAVVGLHLPEQEREGALRIVGLPGDGDA